MMEVALIGATGPVGKRILQELLDRGHRVTAIVRDLSKLPDHPAMRPVSIDVHDLGALSEALRGHEAIISSIRFMKIDAAAMIDAVKRSGVKRYLVVGGAASLYMPGTTTKFLDTGQIPEDYLPEPTAGSLFLDVIKREAELDWTFLSPSLLFSNDEVFGVAPGGRTGIYRLGGDEVLFNEAGDSTISYEDFAVAMVDELEQPRHSRRRFTVGY